MRSGHGPGTTCHFFQIAVVGPVVDEWRYVERDGGTGEPRPFLFSWLPIAQAHVLAAGLGAMLGQINVGES